MKHKSYTWSAIVLECALFCNVIVNSIAKIMGIAKASDLLALLVYMFSRPMEKDWSFCEDKGFSEELNVYADCMCSEDKCFIRH